ncbi:MAG: DNA primase, partial [Lachnospiraceae bacterium]|nr:DNA primase [Lachnospiraceae bacterium]
MNSNIFEEIKSKLDIIEVAKYYGIELNKQNKCCCPFHTEKTPSFSISR